MKQNDDEIRELYRIEKSAYDKYVKLRRGDHARRVTPEMVDAARKEWITKLGALKIAGGNAETLMRVLKTQGTTTRRRKR